MGSGVWDSWSIVQGPGFRILGSVFSVQYSEIRVPCSMVRVQGSGFRVQGSGSRVQGPGFRVQGSGVCTGHDHRLPLDVDCQVGDQHFDAGILGCRFRVQGSRSQVSDMEGWRLGCCKQGLAVRV